MTTPTQPQLPEEVKRAFARLCAKVNNKKEGEYGEFTNQDWQDINTIVALTPHLAPRQDATVDVKRKKDWTHTIHDGEIFLHYKGADAGVLFPNPAFTNWHVNALLATLNAYFPTEPGTRNECPATPRQYAEWAKAFDPMTGEATAEMANAFLRWPLPETVRVDACCLDTKAKHRTGTNLLTVVEALQLVQQVICPIILRHAPDQSAQLAAAREEVERLREERDAEKLKAENSEKLLLEFRDRMLLGEREFIELRERSLMDSMRLHWLHDCSNGVTDLFGYEWGIYRVKWLNGKAVDVLATNSDFSDLDAAMRAELTGQPTPISSKKDTTFFDDSSANKHEITLEQASAIIAHEQAANAAMRCEIKEVKAALGFYAGRLRPDGNGYEFDPEPTGMNGGVARATLRQERDQALAEKLDAENWNQTYIDECRVLRQERDELRGLLAGVIEDIRAIRNSSGEQVMVCTAEGHSECVHRANDLLTRIRAKRGEGKP